MVNSLLNELNIETKLGVVELLASHWNYTEDELLNVINKTMNNFNVTADLILSVLVNVSKLASSKYSTLPETVALITELKPLCLVFDEDKIYDESSTIKVLSNSIKNILNKVEAFVDISETKDDVFGVYQLHKIKWLKERFLAKNSAFNVIAS